MNLKRKKILITGATGFIGGRLIEELMLNHDVEICTLVRDFSTASRIARFNTKMVASNLNDIKPIDNACKGCDIVINCAHDFSSSLKENSKRVKNLIKVISHHGARLVHLSTIDVYGWPDVKEIDENTPKNTHRNKYAETKYRIEEIIHNSQIKDNLLATMIQPTIVYGPYSRPWTISPVNQLRTGKIVLPNDGTGICNTVYIDDVVQAILLASTNDNALGETFLISGQPISWKKFYQAYEEIIGIDSTISMEYEVLNKHINSYYKSAINEIRLFLKALRDPELHDRMAKAPLVRNFYSPLINYIPKSAKERIRSRLFKNANLNNLVPEKKELIYPDNWRLKLYNSQANVKIDKARKILGYNPNFSFEKGINLTSKYIKWANL